jgi:amino acid permease
MVSYELITEIPKPSRPSLIERSFSPLTAGGIRQSTFTLISAAIGGGILCLPFVFSLVGVFIGIILLCIASFLAYISMRMLFLSADRSKTFSYGKLFAHSLDFGYAGPLLDLITIMFGQGVVIAYFVFLGDFIPALGDATGLSIARTVSILACCFFAIPFAWPTKLSALKYLTPVSTLSLLITACVVVYRTPLMHSVLSPEDADVDSFIVSRSILKGFTIAVSSFICHTNVVSVAGELVQPSAKRANKISIRTAAVQLVLYLVIGICGYASFTRGIQQNFLKGYPDDDQLICMCRMMLSFTIFFGLPMNTNPTARAFVNLVQALKTLKSEPLLPDTPSDDSDPMRTLRISAGVVVLITGSIVSLYVPGIADVIGILGGSLGTLIMLVFPALIFAKVFSDEMHRTENRVMVGTLHTAALVCFTSVAVSLFLV